jgi:hypothetical protein
MAGKNDLEPGLSLIALGLCDVRIFEKGLAALARGKAYPGSD